MSFELLKILSLMTGVGQNSFTFFACCHKFCVSDACFLLLLLFVLVLIRLPFFSLESAGLRDRGYLYISLI